MENATEMVGAEMRDIGQVFKRERLMLALSHSQDDSFSIAV